MKHKVAIYCRVDQGGSAEAQKSAMQMQYYKLKQYIRKNNLYLSGEYDDMGYSGCDLHRPGLKHLISDYHLGRFDYVLVVDWDRIFRGRNRQTNPFPFQVRSLHSISYAYE